jgi:uncharacterized protein (DUF1330 family)
MAKGYWIVRVDVKNVESMKRVVIEFPDYASALACYRAPEYQENIKVRRPHSDTDFIIVEGYDGPQP